MEDGAMTATATDGGAEVREPSDGRDLYDYRKTVAFVHAAIDLAEVNGLNLLELAYGARNVMLAAELALADSNAELLERLKAIRDDDGDEGPSDDSSSDVDSDVPSDEADSAGDAATNAAL